MRILKRAYAYMYLLMIGWVRWHGTTEGCQSSTVIEVLHVHPTCSCKSRWLPSQSIFRPAPQRPVARVEKSVHRQGGGSVLVTTRCGVFVDPQTHHCCVTAGDNCLELVLATTTNNEAELTPSTAFQPGSEVVRPEIC